MIAGCIASNILISPVRQHTAEVTFDISDTLIVLFTYLLTAVHCIDASIQLLMIAISISYLSHLSLSLRA